MGSVKIDSRNKSPMRNGESHLHRRSTPALAPGNLLGRGRIDTNSYGMHIGSVSPKRPGSLHFGGYDQNRVVGDVLTSLTSGDYHSKIALEDVAIRVVDGSSPWSFGAA
ncbi:hypothetical protein PG991_007646 [Apiospora marii]|uniref:Uncharacterized protein n=1 Tax=Apiospora marii TaxID=335849 RepID=A0ABR1RV78_9PEZI